jgi:hypothetical protein
MVNFPSIRFPYDVDSAHSLFKVFNNTQSVLSTNLNPTDTTIAIIPAEGDEIWPENGFVTLPNELVYYDEVGYDENGKINSLKRCNRAIEGIAKDYVAGTHVYGMVVSQQHNQLVEAIIAIERNIGELSDSITRTPINFNSMPDTLQVNMNHLLGLNPVIDDSIPQIEFEFNVGIPVAGGTQAEFCVRVFPWNPNWTYELDFGDGTTESTLFQGTHQFAPGGPYTPTVTIVTDTATLVIQAHTVDQGCDVIPSVTSPVDPFHIPIPDVPDFPSFIAPIMSCPGPLLNLPPYSIPSITISPPILSVVCASTTPSVAQGFAFGMADDIDSVGLDEMPINMESIGSLFRLEHDIPRTIQVESGASFPNVLAVDMPKSISLTGVPSTIQLLMPEDPTIELIYKGAPIEMVFKPEVEKLLSQIMIVKGS